MAQSDLASRIERVIAELSGGECVFWACPGANAPFVAMATCRKCSAVQDLRRIAGLIDGYSAPVRLTRLEQRGALSTALARAGVRTAFPGILAWDAVEWLACHGYAVVRIPSSEHCDCPDDDS